MDFRILGPLEVFHDGRAVPVTGTRQRELLALLLLDAGHVVSSDRLMEELWGANQPAAGSTALRVRVSQLRKVLKSGGDDVLVTRPPGYALLVTRDGLDLWRFERALEEGERALRADPQRALDALTQALAEWRGAPLVDVAHAPFAQAATVRLEELGRSNPPSSGEDTSMIVGGLAARHAALARASRRAAMSAIVSAAAPRSAPREAAGEGMSTSGASGTRAEALDATTAASAPARATLRLICEVALSMSAASRTAVPV